MGPRLPSECRVWRSRAAGTTAGAVVSSSGVLPSPGLGTGTDRWEPRPAPEERRTMQARCSGGAHRGLTQGTLRVQPRAVALDPMDSVPEQGTRESRVWGEPRGHPGRTTCVQGAWAPTENHTCAGSQDLGRGPGVGQEAGEGLALSVLFAPGLLCLLPGVHKLPPAEGAVTRDFLPTGTPPPFHRKCRVLQRVRLCRQAVWGQRVLQPMLQPCAEPRLGIRVPGTLVLMLWHHI